MTQLPTWASMLIIILGSAMMILSLISVVFAFSYLLLWQKMRSWFNKRGGIEFMPVKRIERPQIIAAGAGVVLAVILAISSVFGWSAQDAKLTPFTAIMGIIQWGALIWFYIYCRKEYRQKSKLMGKKAAKWSMIYFFGSCATIVILSVTLSTYVMIIYAALFIFDKVWDFSQSSNSGKSSGSKAFHKCCQTCARFSYGKCNNNPGEMINDPASKCCNDYQ